MGEGDRYPAHAPYPLQNQGQNNCLSISLIQFLAYAPCLVHEIRKRQPDNPVLKLLGLYHHASLNEAGECVDIAARLRMLTFDEGQKKTRKMQHRP